MTDHPHMLCKGCKRCTLKKFGSSLVVSLWEEFGIILYPKFVIIINLKQTGVKPAEQTRVAKVDIESFRERFIL